MICSRDEYNLRLTSVEIDHSKSPESASFENRILSLSWYISKSFYQILLVEVSKSKFMNRLPEFKNILAVKQKAII